MGWARKLLRGIRRYDRCPLPGYWFFTAPCVSRRSSLLDAKGSTSTHRPDCFGPFRVRADLGASRFGPVYRGCDPSTDTRVVIRTFELSHKWREFGEQSDLLDSFRKLCEMTLDHPSLARPLAFGAEGNIQYLVYSDLAGTAMDAVMRQDGVRPVAEVLQRTRQLADAIDFAASAGVHHGMMAPCDVILNGERTGITGFGLAQALIKVGIPAEAQSPYGSPQRLVGAPPTLADDIYSLAAITLELLIGTPRDPDQDTKRLLREAHGLPERRRIQRPAAHETRAFTTIADVDAGKLRASFAAAFSEEPSERPSTAAEFVASFQEAISNRHGTEKPAPGVVAVAFVSDEHEDKPLVPVLDMKRAENETLELPSRQERVVAKGRAARRRHARARRRETLAMSQPLNRESHGHEPRERTPENRVVRLAPIVDDALLAEVPTPRANSIDEASSGIPVQSGSRAVLVAVGVAVSLAAGFAGGFIVGQRSRPSTESIDISHDESIADPQPTRAAVEEPTPIASTTQTVAPISEEKVSGSEPIAATTKTVAPLSHATPAANSPGSLLVTSRPSGAQVFVDDELVSTTPFMISNVAVGMRRVRIELSGYKIWTTSASIKPGARFRVSAVLAPQEP